MSVTTAWQKGYERRDATRKAGQKEAEIAAVSALVAVKQEVPTMTSYSDWPISGDDLALARAGVIA